MKIIVIVLVVLIILGLLAFVPVWSRTQIESGKDNTYITIQKMFSGKKADSVPPILSQTTSAKIVGQKQFTVTFGNTIYTAQNNLDKPSLVIAKKGEEIFWQKEISPATINQSLEKDVQLLDYFVTDMKLSTFDSNVSDEYGYVLLKTGLKTKKYELYVTLGKDEKAKTYVLDTESGEVLAVKK